MLAHNGLAVSGKLSRSNFASGSTITGSPLRRNGSFFGVAAVLLFGMYSVASATGRAHPNPSTPTAAVASDPIAEDQSDAILTMNDGTDEATVVNTLNELRDGNPNNSAYSYLMAAHYASRNDWKPALGALEVANETPGFTLAKSPSKDGEYPTLEAMRQLAMDCCNESLRRGSDKTSDAMLQQCTNLANRMAREAMPCDLSVLSDAAGIYETVDRTRWTVLIREGRTHEAKMEQTHLTACRRWWQSVVIKSRHIDTQDPDIRMTVAKSLRSRLSI